MSSTTLQDAIATCEQAIQPTFQQESFQAAAQRVGNVLQSMGRFEEAVIWHTHAQDAEPNFVQIYAGFGRVHIVQEDWDKAISAYKTTLEHNPDFVEAYWKLASIYFTQNQRPQALQQWYQALAFEPHKATPDGHVRFGNAFLKLGKMREALNCYRRAIYIDPNYVPAYRQLAQGFLKQGRREDAVSIYREAVTRVEQPGALYYDLGHIFQDQDQMDQAMATFQHAMEQDPDYPWNHHDWVQLLLDQERWEEAIAASIATIDRNPDLPWAYTQLGRALIATGKREEAINCNQKACVVRGWNSCEEKGYQFSQDWFSHNIPIWQEHLTSLVGQPNLNVCEVGSFQGMSACWMLEHLLTHPSARLTCIDPNFQPEFDINIAQTGVAQKVTKRVGISDHVFPRLPHNSFDLIYVDGCHLANFVKRDGQRAWRKLKPGGILIFDDYHWSDPDYPDQDPKLGIDAVLNEVKAESTILHHGYQVILQKHGASQSSAAQSAATALHGAAVP